MAEDTKRPQASHRTRDPEGTSSRPLDPSAWLQHLISHIPVARDGDDPEGVHQLRVAAGRLDVWLRLGGRRMLRDDLRWLRRAAAPVRDLDVFLGRELPTETAVAARLERARRRRDLAVVLDHPRLHALVRALSRFPPLDACESVRRELSALRARVRARGSRLGSPEAVHAFRRALRRHRYALEWLGRRTGPLKTLQDLLGAANDAAIALRLDLPGAGPLRASLRREYARNLRAAADSWSRLRRRIP